MSWLQHPLIPIAWGAVVMVVYAFFPSTDTAAIVALSVWGAGVLVWMAVTERRPSVETEEQ